jgi:hypothetical protein
MRRRAFITLLGGAAAWPIAVRAQQAGKLPLVGVLVSASPPHPFADALRRGLQTLGYSEGRNIALEVRYSGGRSDRAGEILGSSIGFRHSRPIWYSGVPFLTSAFTGSKLRPEGIEMSRGHGKWERLIMQTLDQREAFYLLELFPPGRAPWEHRSDLRIRALRRAARNLGNAGKVRRFYDSRDRQRRLVIARPGVGVETLRRCLPRMSDRGRIELDLRLRDEESAASLTETNNELYLEPYHQWLNEHGLTDDQEAYEGWLDEQHWVEVSDDDQ